MLGIHMSKMSGGKRLMASTLPFLFSIGDNGVFECALPPLVVIPDGCGERGK